MAAFPQGKYVSRWRDGHESGQTAENKISDSMTSLFKYRKELVGKEIAGQSQQSAKTSGKSSDH